MISVRQGAVALVVFALASSGCSSCVDDELPGPWPFAEPDTQVADTSPPPDVGDATDTRDTRDVVELEDARDVVELEDASDAEDIEDVDAWQSENVVSRIDCDEVREDRTTNIVDSDGTVWIGYHDFAGPNCTDETLTVVHKRPGGDWIEESLQPHESPLYVLSSVRPDEPLVVYPDSSNDALRAAQRQPSGEWAMHDLDVDQRSVSQGDGFDVTNDGGRFFVTFAGGSSDVELFSRSASSPNVQWETRRRLEVDRPRAAMERGLRADENDSLYLVNRNVGGGGGERTSIARYDKVDDRWADRARVDSRYASAFTHSLVLTDDRELCMSHRYEQDLLVTCGTMFDLDARSTHFDDRRIARRYPSSMVEGDDGTLYVAFHDPQNSQLGVAKRNDGEWSFRTVYDGSAYGVSTAIDTTGDMVLSFYTCDEPPGPDCSLKVLREDPSAL